MNYEKTSKTTSHLEKKVPFTYCHHYIVHASVIMSGLDYQLVS